MIDVIFCDATGINDTFSTVALVGRHLQSKQQFSRQEETGKVKSWVVSCSRLKDHLPDMQMCKAASSPELTAVSTQNSLHPSPQVNSPPLAWLGASPSDVPVGTLTIPFVCSTSFSVAVINSMAKAAYRMKGLLGLCGSRGTRVCHGREARQEQAWQPGRGRAITDWSTSRKQSEFKMAQV